MYIPQEARYAVYEDFGCLVPIDNSFVGNILGLGPPLMAAVISAVYSGSFIQHHNFKIAHDLTSASSDYTSFVQEIFWA